MLLTLSHFLALSSLAKASLKRMSLAIFLQLFDLFKCVSFVCDMCSNQKIDHGPSEWERVLNGKACLVPGEGSP